MYQKSIFVGEQPFKIDKPIRLITLFSGYDSQALALKYLGVPFEHYRTCEWAIPSIQALHDLHFGEDKTDYSQGMSKAELVEVLAKYGISADYNQPLTAEQIKRYGEEKLRTIYNNIKSAHNMVSICNAKGADLGVCDTDKYCYIMTYSFPCQDLSNAGLQKGMARGGQTRSGLLWEVERLLKESEELPQVVLMENVPQVIGKKNIGAFAEWLAILDNMGYHSNWQVINATDFCVPQNRQRCFMVSVLNDYFYTMPPKMKETRKLGDVLEEKVDKNYYLSEKQIEKYREQIERARAKGMNLKFEPIDGGASENADDEPGKGIRHLCVGITRKSIGKPILAAYTLCARDGNGLSNREKMVGVIEWRNITER